MKRLTPRFPASSPCSVLEWDVGERTDRSAMSDNWKADLQPLFTPRSIALIGASESSSRSRALFNNLTEFGYRGKIFPVHPKRPKHSASSVIRRSRIFPKSVDACVIAIPRDHVIAALEGCAEKGVRAAVIVSAGFAEASAEGKALQDRITANCRGGQDQNLRPELFWRGQSPRPGRATARHGRASCTTGKDRPDFSERRTFELNLARGLGSRLGCQLCDFLRQ